MVNKEKAIKIELTRFRKTQNPEQIDFRRMRKLRAAKTSLFKLKRKGTVAPVKEASTEKKKAKPTKKPKKKDEELEVIEDEPELEVSDKEPELEVVEEEPELEVVEDEPESEKISKDLEDLYSYDEDIDEEDVKEDSE